MPISDAVVDAVNDQIQKELASAYVYMAMLAWFETRNLPGFAHWMKLQCDEEIDHARRLYAHVIDRGGMAKFHAIEAPPDDFGSVIAAVEKVESHIADAVAKGGRVVTGGSRHELGGSFFQPTVVTDATPEMLVARDETFGPLAPLFRFGDEEQAVAMANDTEFGLAAYFYTRDLGRAWRVSEALEYGIVGVNAGIISNEVAPFGGVKESGIGREGSKYGIDDFVEIKYVRMGGIDG